MESNHLKLNVPLLTFKSNKYTIQQGSKETILSFQYSTLKKITTSQENEQGEVLCLSCDFYEKKTSESRYFPCKYPYNNYIRMGDH